MKVTCDCRKQPTGVEGRLTGRDDMHSHREREKERLWILGCQLAGNRSYKKTEWERTVLLCHPLWYLSLSSSLSLSLSLSHTLPFSSARPSHFCLTVKVLLNYTYQKEKKKSTSKLLGGKEKKKRRVLLNGTGLINLMQKRDGEPKVPRSGCTVQYY